MTIVRGRFAPTPSGEMHLGNVYAALLGWLQARSAGGRFVLRIEDIDKPRSKPQHAMQLVDDLRWLGLDWDEGPDIGGPHAPYVQSEREALYAEAIERLDALDLLYPCYCSRAELQAIASAPHGLQAEGGAYPGLCRDLSTEERSMREQRKKPSLRFKLPNHDLDYVDLAAGPQRVPAGAGGDFVVRRADGIVSYQLAVVVDDAAMGITDVLRGYDLLDSTPRQLALYEALGLEPPRFTHVPLLCGPGGERLAKRHGDLSARAMRARGLAPETIVGVLAALCGLQERPEPVAARELVDHFALERLPRGPITLSHELLRRIGGA
ncbi:tRNA glutamyl-Q(34) synthetase GluQRS [Paenibacillus sp. IB182496]|uniref:Glutamyl-Q tRNA(Asp) synthetase n=1 Tax=Paenibacillus sabuli TaxID=2772509 RepID=A0A927GSY8_9BACL|nr:tRNA glutamyl-Q(34) synthetase GluQRS [Paenibacillus sabuli]MBD2846781.1 tRNA glutamyl-Q(34) synthetase GluQRS [Paenibacillus sabuli]